MAASVLFLFITIFLAATMGRNLEINMPSMPETGLVRCNILEHMAILYEGFGGREPNPCRPEEVVLKACRPDC